MIFNGPFQQVKEQRVGTPIIDGSESRFFCFCQILSIRHCHGLNFFTWVGRLSDQHFSRYLEQRQNVNSNDCYLTPDLDEL